MVITRVALGFQRVESAIHGITVLARRVASIVLAFMILLIAADVFGRYILNRSIRGTVDIIEETLIFIVFFTAAEVASLNRHIKVDLVISVFSEKIQSILFCFTSFASLVISVLITWQVTLRGWSLIVRPTLTTLNLEWPLGPFYMVVAFGFLLLCLEFAVTFVNSVIRVFHGEAKS